MQIIMATNNVHKLSEIQQILGPKYQIKGLKDIGCYEDIPETSTTLSGNALQKARYVWQRYGLNCFADDTGLEVEALGGAPGIFTARFGVMNGYGEDHDSSANIRCLLDKLSGVTNRRACFRTIIALIQEGRELLFEGSVSGSIVNELRGTDGFGYDPVFEVEQTGLTFAQMGIEQKNRVSHRARATQQLIQYLRSCEL